MRLPYQFNEISDPKDAQWGMNTSEMLSRFVHTKTPHYSTFSEARDIEGQIEILVGAIGGLAEVLISKGRMSPKEFIAAIEAEDVFEVRENRQR